MTTPTNNGQPQEQAFMPDPHFAFQAQQEEIDRLHADNKALYDQKTYQRAVVLQLQAESNHRASLLQGEIENGKVREQAMAAEIEKLRHQLFALQPESPVDPEAAAIIDRELDENVTLGDPEYDPDSDPDLIDEGLSSATSSSD